MFICGMVLRWAGISKLKKKKKNGFSSMYSRSSAHYRTYNVAINRWEMTLNPVHPLAGQNINFSYYVEGVL